MSDIRFSADPTSVLRAMQDIQRAIQRAGQEGKAFSDMDLSHPELKDLERDMSRLRSSMLALQRISPGSQFTRGLRDSGQAGRDPWAVDWQRAFPEQQHRERALQRLAQGSGHAYGMDGAGGRPPAGGAFGGFPGAGQVGALARTVLPLAMGGGIVASMMRGLREGDQTSQPVDTLMRFDELGRTFDELRDSVTGLVTRFGLANAEAARLTEGYARASGEVEGATDAVKDSVAFARGLGMNAEGTTSSFGSLQFSGAFERQDRREFATMLAEMIGRSGMYARGDELLGQVTRMADRVWESTLEAPNTRAIMEMYAAMFDVSAATGKTALKGAAGERILSAADAGIRGAGDEAKEFFMYRALSGVTGDIYKQRYLRDYGAFGTPDQAFGDGDTRPLFRIVMDQFRHDAAGLNNQHAEYSALGGFFGLTSRQAKALMAVDDQMRKSGLGEMGWLMEQSGVDMSSMDASGLGQIAKIIEAARSDGVVNVEDVADRIRKAAKDGRIDTVSTDMAEATANLTDQLDQLMRESRPLLTQLTAEIAELTAAINDAKRATQRGQVIDDAARPWLPAPRSNMDLEELRQERERMENRGPFWFFRRQSGSAPETPETTGALPSREAMEAVDAKYGLPRGTIWALTKTESNHNPNAVSSAGAVGLAQFMPATAGYMGLDDPFDPHQSIEAAGKYMRYLLDKPYVHSLPDALAAYNAGPGNFRDKGAFYWNEPTQHRNRFEEHFQAYQQAHPGTLTVNVIEREAGPPEIEVEVDGHGVGSGVGDGAYSLDDFAFGRQ